MISSNESIEIVDINKNYQQENNEYPEIVNLPYITKRIQQNLKDIDFGEDSDDTAEWDNSDSDDDLEITDKQTPKRLRIRN